MRAVRVSEDIVPVSDFKAQAAEWLKRIAETDQPIIITQNGKAAGVLLSPAQFDALSERARFVSAIDSGLADSEAGRVHSHAAVVAELTKRRRVRKSR
jgi:prevent-host-death family protein